MVWEFGSGYRVTLSRTLRVSADLTAFTKRLPRKEATRHSGSGVWGCRGF